jgi:hypothetical protein
MFLMIRENISGGTLSSILIRLCNMKEWIVEDCKQDIPNLYSGKLHPEYSSKQSATGVSHDLLWIDSILSVFRTLIFLILEFGDIDGDAVTLRFQQSTVCEPWFLRRWIPWIEISCFSLKRNSMSGQKGEYGALSRRSVNRWDLRPRVNN